MSFLPHANPFKTDQALAVLISLCVCLSLATTSEAQTAEQLTEDEIQYDADVKSQVDKTGEYRLSIQALPYRLFLETLNDFGAIKDKDEARKDGNTYTWMVPNKGEKPFSYEVWAPEEYDPASPPGVVVFINAGNSGKFQPSYRKVLAAKNLIVIGANESGNEIDTGRRATFAFYAVELMNRRYKIDPQRVYVTGTSGGGRVASHVMFYRPDMFKGGLPMIGCMAPIANGNEAFRRGAPPMHNMPTKAALREAAMNGRYVFLTGEKDFNRKECEATAKYLNDIGFKFATVMVQPGLDHKSNSPEYFGMALDFLDAPLCEVAAKRIRDAQKDMQRGRLDDAIAGFEEALPHLSLSSDEANQALAKESQAQLADLKKQYDAAVAKLDQAIEAKDAAAATEALRELQRGWRDRLGRDAANEYRKTITELRRAE